MSGAAGLAAAKRRRGGSNNTPQTTNSQQTRNSPQQSQTNQNPSRMTPLQVLQQHHVRIERLENDVSTNSNSDVPNNETLNDIIKRLGNLEVSILKGTENSNVEDKRVTTDEHIEESKEDIDFFKDKTLLLERQISELKQTMLKIQSFAMETNDALMKYKNGIKELNDSTENDETDREVSDWREPLKKKMDVKIEAKITTNEPQHDSIGISENEEKMPGGGQEELNVETTAPDVGVNPEPEGNVEPVGNE